jgi:high-affinity nickel-transport protein
VTLLAVLALGFVLGLRHATDADHVVAITTLVTRERSPRSALVLGACWGIGHTLTLFFVGGAIVAFGLVVPPRLGLSLEMTVAVMLILLGAFNLSGAGERLEKRSARAAALASLTPAPTLHQRLRSVLRRGGRALVVGTVHGLAGSAALALLVLTTVHDARSAFAYLAVFGAGTIASMMLVTALLAVPLRLAAARFASAERVLARGAGALSLAFGLFLAYRIGFVSGLLSGDLKWTPE